MMAGHGSRRDMCRDMNAIQTPHSTLVGFFRTSRNGRRISCGRQVLVDEYKQLQRIQEFIRRTSYSTTDCISNSTDSNWLLWFRSQQEVMWKFLRNKKYS